MHMHTFSLWHYSLPLFSTISFPLLNTTPRPPSPISLPFFPVSFSFSPYPRFPSSPPSSASPTPQHRPSSGTPLAFISSPLFDTSPLRTPVPSSSLGTVRPNMTEWRAFRSIRFGRTKGLSFSLTYQAEQHSLCSIKQDRTDLCLALFDRTKNRCLKRGRWSVLENEEEMGAEGGHRERVGAGELGGCWRRGRR